MCFSPLVSYGAAGILIPAGAVAMVRAYQRAPQYLAIAALPSFFGFQQLFEGLVWTAGNQGAGDWIERFALAYMFFTWFAWPVWVPFATYFLEPCARRHIYLVFAIFGGILGAMQFIPYFAHEGWLEVRFFDYAISYEGTVLFDLIMRRELTYLFYLSVILAPLLTSSKRGLNVFGLLLLVVLGITYTFFSYAYISVFCFGGAVMSLYLVYMIFHETGQSATASGTVDLDQETLPSPSVR